MRRPPLLLLALVAALSAPVRAEDRGGTAGVEAKASTPAAVEGGPRRWQVIGGGPLELRDAPSSDAPVIGTLDEGALLPNTGCVAARGEAWCAAGTATGMRGHVPARRLRAARAIDGTVPMGPDDSARRARKGDFDARGVIRCAQERGQELGDCEMGVARSGGGDATVVLRFPNGFARLLYFTNGAFVSANATMSGVGTDTDQRRQDERHLIRVDDQRYELPDEILFGD